MKLFIAALLCVLPAFPANKLIFKITGSEKTVCTLYKVPGTVISTTGQCKTGDGLTTVTMPDIKATSLNINQMSWSYAEVMCIMAVNPTSLPAEEGTFLNVPAWGIAWACSGTAGIISTGSITWP